MEAILRSFTLALLFLLCYSDRALACSCMAHSPCESVAHGSVIFEATVQRVIEPTEDPFVAGRNGRDVFRQVNLRDIRAWRGEPAATVITHAIGSMCGYNFKVGTRYIVVAERKDDGQLRVSLCSLTQPAEQPSALRFYLDHVSPSVGGGTVVGSALVAPGFAASRHSLHDPVSGAGVTLSGPVVRTGVATRDGRFAFTGLPFGSYTLTADVPADRPDIAPFVPATVELTGSPTCAAPELKTTYQGSMTGIVVDERGQPQVGMLIGIRNPARFPTGLEPPAALSDAAGVFEFTQLPAGRYQLSVGPPASGSDDIAVTLAPGTQIVLEPLVWHRPDPVQVSGVARWADGRIASRLEVLVGSGDEPFPRYHAVTTTDIEGRFSFMTIRGQRLSVRIHDGPNGEARLRITAGDPPIHVTLQAR